MLSILLSLSLIIQESFIHANRPALGLIRRKLLLAFSDQQILYGIGIQAVGLAQVEKLVPYHFFIIWMVSLLSTAVHNSSLLVLADDFHSDKVLQWARQVLILVQLLLSCVFGVYMLRILDKDLGYSTLPTACAWDPAFPTGMRRFKEELVPYVGAISVILGNFIVFGAATWLLHDRRRRGYKWIQLAGISVMIAIAVAAMVGVVLTSQAFGTPLTNLADHGESEWSFSTIVALVMTALPLMTVLEMYRGQVEVN